MRRLFHRLRRHLSFANVASGAALFIALGGTSYAAIALPANSVGPEQIRTGAVGKAAIRSDAVGASELKTNSVRARQIKPGSVGETEMAKDAVTANAIKDGNVGLTKLDAATRAAISAGPFRADVTADGGAAGGDATAITHPSTGVYTVDFGSDVSKCTPVASLPNVDAANVGAATVALSAVATAVTVHTFTPGTGTGSDPTTPQAADLPFHVIVAC